MQYSIHTIMKAQNKTEKQAIKIFMAEAKRLWPLAKGSLAEVRKPCIRPNCKACATGKKHRAFMFTFKEKEIRRCMYVPIELAPVLRRALRNGRLLEKRMSHMGAELILRFRQRQTTSKSIKGRRKKSG